MKYLFLYLAAVLLLAVFVTQLDKRNARLHRRRVPERTLFFIALCGGAAAMFVTMRVIRHKTRHKRFMIGLPLIVLLQGVLLLFLQQNQWI